MILQYTPKRILLLIADVVIMYGALYIAICLRLGYQPSSLYFLNFLPSFAFIFFFSVLIYFSYGLYDKPSLRLVREMPERIWTSQFLTAIIAVVFYYTLPQLGLAPKTLLFIYLGIAGVATILWRRTAYKVLLRYRKMSAIAIGSGKAFSDIVDEIDRNPHSGISLLLTARTDSYDLSSIAKTLDTLKPDALIIDLYDDKIKPYFGVIYEHFQNRNMLILDLIDAYEDVFNKIPADIVNQEWMFRHISKKNKYHTVKYLLDLVIALPVLIVAAIILPIVWLVMKIKGDGSMLFVQERIGLGGLPFKIYKVRTMTNVAVDSIDDTVSRVTPFGSFLRRTRIDELPQIWNVIRGDVSLVGPRPETVSLVAKYTQSLPYYPVRHLVRPGLSGWAQIEQKNAPKFGVDISETANKLAYDIYYLKHASITLDLSILIKTIKVIISRSGQ